MMISDKNKKREISLSAYAKINLTLDVGGLRPDGYHEIASVMQTITLADTLWFARIPSGIEVISDNPGVPSGCANLAYRALEVIAHQLPGGVRVLIEKRIPWGAGLGGGSSNAAAALRGADLLYNCGIKEDDLLAAAAEVGSDVPFFIKGGTALAEGRGERLTKLPQLPVFWVVLVRPLYTISTAKVYSLYQSKGREPQTPGLIEALQKGEYHKIPGLLGNDLEEVTVSLHPEIGDIKQQLFLLGAAAALMSGSGPTVFGLFHDQGTARQAAERIREKGGPDVFVCRTCSAE
ncbi:MAG: 4-(cytidine 5'-diphospho)-2-C-methyl-D-erythritol kinase [Thermacetogeniaceae bacterium]|jgi:4-diphosphocytidyl-2-C-methyl-D-erythritol kinase|nr:4-(cytidine 5'-diphospho)-2-C-methyl-D-erythritol kinase [Peptococcaceae bacterium]